MSTHTEEKWSATKCDDGAWMVHTEGDIIVSDADHLTEKNSYRISAVPDLIDIAVSCLDIEERAKYISAPEDSEIESLCERIGYGAVMDAAARLWFKKDPIGAFTVGPCFTTVKAAILKAEGRDP